MCGRINRRCFGQFLDQIGEIYNIGKLILKKDNTSPVMFVFIFQSICSMLGKTSFPLEPRQPQLEHISHDTIAGMIRTLLSDQSVLSCMYCTCIQDRTF